MPCRQGEVLVSEIRGVEGPEKENGRKKSLSFDTQVITGLEYCCFACSVGIDHQCLIAGGN